MINCLTDWLTEREIYHKDPSVFFVLVMDTRGEKTKKVNNEKFDWLIDWMNEWLIEDHTCIENTNIFLTILPSR